jgi:hypothetical protein
VAWKILIAGVDKTSEIAQDRGVSVDLVFNERGTARFTTLPGYIPDLRASVVIYDQDGTTPIFGGVIFQRETSGIGAHTFTVCECADWTWYLDRLTIEGGELTGTITLEAALDWLQIRFAPYGFTLDPAQATGPSATVTGFTWERKYASDVLRDLTAWTGGWVFQVDPDQEWRMVSPSLAAPTAPFTITDGNSNARVLDWRETSEHYATQVILRCGGTGTRDASESWTIDAAIIAAGYVETAAPSTPTGGVSATIDTGSGAVAATVGTSGTQLIWDWETHRLTAGTYVPVVGDVVVLNYTAQYPFEVVADAGVSPAIEIVESLEDMTDPATAQALADGKLLAAYQSPRTFEIDSVVDGLRPGQVIAISSTHRATSANALITRVSISMVTNDIWTYRATATTGIYTGSGLDFWRSLGGGVGGATTPSVTYSPAPPVGTIVGEALTRVDDTNVTLTLGGTPATALLEATSLTLGWTGTLAAARLNANVVQSVVDDSNVTGDISAQALTLGWSGQLPVTRGGTGLAAAGTGRLLYGANTDPLASSANLTFDGTALNSHTVNVTAGNLNLAASAHPTTNYHSNLGSLSRKYLTLHAAELWVETLVAQNTMATIGGRVLVAPTTLLTEDFSPSDTTIHVKHNNLANGDRVYLESGGRVEWIAITSGPTGGAAITRYHPLVGLTSRASLSASYSYTVTRNLDGTGANQWYAGDAVLNTGTTGDGFIDLYSLSGVLSGAGPTIVGNVRTGTTYSQIAPRWAIGNLNGLYGYSGDIYGSAFGDNSNAWLKIDSTNGLRMGHNATTYVEIDPSGNATFAGQVTIGTGRNQLSNSFGSPIVRLETPDGDGTNWGTISTTTGLTVTAGVNLDDWRLENSAGTPTNGSAYMTAAGTPSAATTSVFYGPKFPVQAGQEYEWSFYGGVHRAGNLVARISWLTNAGALVSSSDAATPITASAPGGKTLTEWGRTGVIATAPPTATQAQLEAHQTHTAEANPYTFVMRMFFGEAQPGQTALSPWAPGGQTLITGDSITTDFISASTIRSSGASALSTGAGFWIDASTGTPTFRVGDPAANHLTWNGTTLTLAGALSAATGTFAGSLSAATGTFAGSLSAATGTFSGSISAATGTFTGNLDVGGVTIDSGGITVEPGDSGTSYVAAQSYRWTVSNGELGITGADGSGDRQMWLHSNSTSSGPAISVVGLSAVNDVYTTALQVVASDSGLRTVQVTADSMILIAKPDFRGGTSTTIGAAGGASALPANPVGYIQMYYNGTAYKMPYYNT